MKPADEWAFVRPIYEIVDNTAHVFALKLIRVFGDGFLLYSVGALDDQHLNRATGFLASLRDQLARKGVTLKASIVGGDFVAHRKRDRHGDPETVLVGAVANLAGKAISKVRKGAVVVSWPISLSGLSTDSYDAMLSDSDRRHSVTIDVSRLNGASSILDLAGESLWFGSKDAGAKLEFSGDVKNVLFETIKMADDKAKAAFAVSGALLVYLVNGGWFHPPDYSADQSVSSWLHSALWAVSIVVLLISSVFALRVLYPRVPKSYQGLVFYEFIAAWKSPEDYYGRLSSLDSEGLARESALHNFDVAAVAKGKYSALRCCIWSMAIGVGVAIVWILSWFLHSTSAPIFVVGG